MAEMGRWNEHVFEVSPNLIRGWTDLQIKGSSGTENKESEGQQYVARKKGNAAELSFTLRLHALTGCSVREEALAYVEEAQAGESGYFYVGGEKLLPFEMMLTDATVSETEITNSGIWVRADVQISMRQASPRDREETPEAAVETGRVHSQYKLNGKRGGYNNGVKTVQMIMQGDGDMARYQIDNLPAPIDMQSENQRLRRLQNAKNLLMCRLGEVPYDRLRGVDPALLEMPISTLRNELLPELDRVMLWEPGVEVVSAEASLLPGSQVYIKVILDVEE